MPIFEGLGRSLRWLRERQVKRQYQVAEGAGITKAMLSAYETGKQKPSLDTLEKILEALVCDLNDLHNALQIVNERPEALRRPGEPDGAWFATRAVRGPQTAQQDSALYDVLGIQRPLPPQEEQALSEMLGGFHKLLRFMHDRVTGSLAPDKPPPQPDSEPEGTA
ncbi:MAG TPA: helix-turn-helix transcriptional regulator [Thermoanaerobaculia bacterium]|nr:helix-turn-helix transcriptional regulator [Thermoanaerobaculia bacterium]